MIIHYIAVYKNKSGQIQPQYARNVKKNKLWDTDGLLAAPTKDSQVIVNITNDQGSLLFFHKGGSNIK